MKLINHSGLLVLVLHLAIGTCDADTIRFATFNTSLNRRSSGQLVRDLRPGENFSARKIAEIIQRVRPDVILLNEFDYDADGEALKLFRGAYLSVSQNGQEPISFAHHYVGTFNTGEPTEFDLDKDGKTGGPADRFGFGMFPGQYGMVVLSNYPIDQKNVRTFQKFLWQDMPSAKLPVDPKTQKPFYDEAELAKFRLSSKSHWDIPIDAGEGDERATVHFLACHPTPPVFDGPEDRNGCRNHDEIRLFADYVSPDRSKYIYDDVGKRGGLAEGATFIIAGDMNSDPVDGESSPSAIRQLTEHPLIRADMVPTSKGGAEQSKKQGKLNLGHKGNPAYDTGDFNDGLVGNLRIDYVLPSRNLTVKSAGIFWPTSDEPGFDLIDASDHRLVWVDIEM